MSEERSGAGKTTGVCARAFKIKPRVSRKTAHGTSSDTHRGGLSRVPFHAREQPRLSSSALFFPPLCAASGTAMQHRPRAVALVASLRPDLRTVSDCACHRSGSAHANHGIVENLGIQNLGEALLSQIQKENLQVVRNYRQFNFGSNFGSREG